MKHYTLFILLIVSALSVQAQTEVPQSQKVNYFNHTQVSLLIGEESEDQTRKAMIPSFQTVTGLRLGEHFGIGLGVGVEPFRYVAFPVFMSGYYFLSDKKIAPYFAAKAGYAFANSHKRLAISSYYYNGDFNNKGGLMLNPEIGFRIKMPYFDMTLSGGYRFQHLESRISAKDSPYTYKHKVDYHRVSIALGIMF